MNQTEVNRIADQLHFGYAGPAWHGDHITKVLADVQVEQLASALPNSHSIAEIIEHMIAWRVFVIKNMQGEVYDITKDAVNFPKAEQMDVAYWQDLQARLEKSQAQLLGLIRSWPDEKLWETVPGRKYTFYILLHGIVQHDLYHLGQIVLLKKLQPERS